eukprot:scaffold19663_cov46-Prasinocladus_malaysianus.AAC.2
MNVCSHRGKRGYPRTYKCSLLICFELSRSHVMQLASGMNGCNSNASLNEQLPCSTWGPYIAFKSFGKTPPSSTSTSSCSHKVESNSYHAVCLRNADTSLSEN